MTYVDFLSLCIRCHLDGRYRYPFGVEWDARLRQLLDTQEAKLGYLGHCIHLGDVQVWTGNSIYEFGYDQKAPSARKRRPSMTTMYRLWKLREELLADTPAKAPKIVADCLRLDLSIKAANQGSR